MLIFVFSIQSIVQSNNNENKTTTSSETETPFPAEVQKIKATISVR